MKVLSLDLEMMQPSENIIQIGACIGILETGEVIDKFSQLVNPGEPLSEFITTLTGITDAAIAESGVSLIEAHERFRKWLGPHSDRFLNAYTWGGGDSMELKRQLERTGIPFTWPLGRRWFDVKTLFQFRQKMIGAKPQAGLAKALIKLGRAFKGRKHNALDDSINTFYVAHHLFSKGFT